jgi:hypothetical protein
MWNTEEVAVVEFQHKKTYVLNKLVLNTRWFKYDRDDLCVNKSQFVPVIFEPPCSVKPWKTRVDMCSVSDINASHCITLIYLGRASVDWIYLAQDRGKWPHLWTFGFQNKREIFVLVKKLPARQKGLFYMKLSLF